MTARTARPPVDTDLMTALALATGLLALFVFRHEYLGIQHDAEIYTLLALRIVDPVALAGDEFFRNVSQGSFTVFPWAQAQLLQVLSIEQAAWVLTRAGQALWVASAWLLARRVLPGPLHWLALALLLALPGHYGAQGVFSYCESFATPRAWAEAFVMLGLACGLAGRWSAAVAAVAVAAVLHPIMALPGIVALLLVQNLWRNGRWLVATGAMALAAAIAVAFLHPVGPLRLIDSTWLAGVRLFAGYLLPDDWQLMDWQRVVVPGATLLLALLVLKRGRLCGLAGGALLLGIAGIVLTFLTVHGLPIAALVQGQPWRWTWLTRLAAVLLLPALGAELWRRGAAGRGVMALLTAAWLGSEDALGLEAALAMILFAVLALRSHRTMPVLGHVAAGLGAAACFGVVWITGLTHWMIGALAAVAVWVVLFRMRPPGLAVAAVALALAATLGMQAVRASRLPLANDYDSLERQLAPWRRLVAPDRTVLFTTNLHASWLALHRRAFLVMAGVAFSRDSTLEAMRRSAQLEPPGHPRFTLGKDEVLSGPAPSFAEFARVCRIPGLDFVVTPFEYPAHHIAAYVGHPFGWLLLYDCRQVADAARDGA